MEFYGESLKANIRKGTPKAKAVYNYKFDNEGRNLGERPRLETLLFLGSNTADQFLGSYDRIQRLEEVRIRYLASTSASWKVKEID